MLIISGSQRVKHDQSKNSLEPIYAAIYENILLLLPLKAATI